LESAEVGARSITLGRRQEGELGRSEAFRRLVEIRPPALKPITQVNNLSKDFSDCDTQ
jgi:hypothetical protein